MITTTTHFPTTITYAKGMSAQQSLAYRRRSFAVFGQQIDKSISRTVQSKRIFATWQCDFFGLHILSNRASIGKQTAHLFAQFDARFVANVHQFVNTAERWLCLTRHQMRANAEYVDRVALLLQRTQRALVDVVGGDNRLHVTNSERK